MTLDPAGELLLNETGVLRLTTRGRRTGLVRIVELRFVYEEGHLLLLAACRDGHAPDWYRNLVEDSKVHIEVDARAFFAEAASATEHDVETDDILALFRDKYGMQLVKVWYEGVPCLPVVIRITAIGSRTED